MKKNLQATLAAVFILFLSVACAGINTSSTQSNGGAHNEKQADAGAAIPALHPKFKSTGLSASWIDPQTGLKISNDMWNCPQTACGTQEIWANSSSEWGVVSQMGKGNQAILTYPAAQRQFSVDGNPAPLADIRELKSTFTESMPTTSGTIAESAYDIWLNDWNTEIMIWVDNQNQNFTTPAVGVTTLNGKQFAVYAVSGTSNGYPRGPFYFVIKNNETSGTVDILAAIKWVEDHGYMSASGAGLNAVDFGWEIASTNGEPESFAVSSYSLSVTGIKLSAGISGRRNSRDREGA